jgi:hypothetical protein
MADIQSPRLLYFKGASFLFLGTLAASLLLAEHASWKFAALLALAIWSFARAYYFAFYVIEHYIDSKFKFSGLWDFAQYVLRRRHPGGNAEGQASAPIEDTPGTSCGDHCQAPPTMPSASPD